MNRSTYNEAIADEICDRIIDGESLREIAQHGEMPHRATVMRWLAQYPEFATKYAYAKQLSAEHEDEEMVAIERKVLAGELDPQAARVVLWSKQWRASKLNPKKYGDRVDVTGDSTVNVTVEELSVEERAKRVAMVMARGLAAVRKQQFDKAREEASDA